MTRVNDIFGNNLRQLVDRRDMRVAPLCRDLGINRTQFNRYLSGESHPRPDVLKRICDFFEVDARVLLQHLAEIEAEIERAREDLAA
ncbi:helix-turn-helix domain-containing protein [Pseudooceanicola sp.]|uniref:helix-turn-helix domain-containing protein n=1 Tax=Pseudooceanicola sp. TaxID=1914328 RepID=UPI0035C6F929